MTLTEKVSRNLQYNAIGKMVEIFTPFVLIAYLFTKISKELYGINILVLAFSGWAGIMDLGVGQALMKYVAEYKSKGDFSRLEKIINTSASFYGIIAILSGMALLVFSFFFEKVFNIPPDYILQGRQLFWVGAFTAFSNWILFPFQGAVLGLQRFDVINKISILTNATNLALVYIIFSFTDSYWFYLFCSQLFITFFKSFYFVTLHKELPEMRFSLFYFDKETFRFIFKFSFYFFAAGICDILIFQMSSVLIGIYLVAAEVAIYSIAFKIQQAIRTINGLLGFPINVLSSEIEGMEAHQKQEHLLFKGTMLETAIFIPIVIITFVFAQQLIINWVGKDFFNSVLPLRILLVFWFINGTIVIVQSVIFGKGEVDIFLYINLSNALFNFILSIIFIKYWGIVGIALGTTLSMCIASAIGIRMMLTRLKIKGKDFWERSVSPNLFYYLIVVLLAFCAKQFLPGNSIYLAVLEMAGVYVTGCMFYYFFSLDNEDKVLVQRLLKIRL